MKLHLLKLSFAILLLGSLAFESCKSKQANTDTTTTNADTSTMNTTPSAAPVNVSNDDALRSGVTDATKDYPNVKATVDNGEITLNGSIKRADLQQLMMSLNSLHPKKINNNLTVK